MSRLRIFRCGFQFLSKKITEPADLLRLEISGRIGVDIHSRADVCVAEKVLNHFHVDTGFTQSRRASMTK